MAPADGPVEPVGVHGASGPAGGVQPRRDLGDALPLDLLRAPSEADGEHHDNRHDGQQEQVFHVVQCAGAPREQGPAAAVNLL